MNFNEPNTIKKMWRHHWRGCEEARDQDVETHMERKPPSGVPFVTHLGGDPANRWIPCQRSVTVSFWQPSQSSSIPPNGPNELMRIQSQSCPMDRVSGMYLSDPDLPSWTGGTIKQGHLFRLHGHVFAKVTSQSNYNKEGIRPVVWQCTKVTLGFTNRHKNVFRTFS